jgi:hypothetical protein
MVWYDYEVSFLLFVCFILFSGLRGIALGFFLRCTYDIPISGRNCWILFFPFEIWIRGLCVYFHGSRSKLHW